MPARIIETKHIGGNKAIVTIEGDNHDELGTIDIREAAQMEASKVITRPGISEDSGPYPVDDQGIHNEDVVLGKVAVAAYRKDLTFQGI